MIDQHKHIKGYRDLTKDEIALMNEIKTKAEEVRVLTEKLRTMPGLDQRWVSIGITELQQGFMAIVRGVARPETF